MPAHKLTQPKWALRSQDEIVQFLVRNGIRVTRSSYIGLNWMNDIKNPALPLPAELEEELPEPLQWKRKRRIS